MMGDYLLQSVRNNGRNVYRTKEVVLRNNLTDFIYLYSFDADEYADHEDYEKLKDAAGAWAVSFIKYWTMNNDVTKFKNIEKKI